MFPARTIVIAITLAAASDAAAQSGPPAADATPNGGDRVTIAAGIGFAPSYEGSNDAVVIPAAAIDAEIAGFHVFTRQTHLYLDAISRPKGSSVDFEAGPVVGLRLNRNARVIDPQVRALGRRRLAVEAGGFIGLAKTGVFTSPYDTLGARVTILRDVSGIHRSTIIQPSISYFTPLSRRTIVTLSASADFVERGYAQTYFGVDAAGSARSGLPVFTPRGGLKSYSLGALAMHSLEGDIRQGLNVFATGSYTRLLRDFSFSPVTRIAGSPHQWVGVIGLGYTF